jgi:hypothetical protein
VKRPMRDVSLEKKVFSWQIAQALHPFTLSEKVGCKMFRVTGKGSIRRSASGGKSRRPRGFFSAAVRMFLLVSCLIHTTLNNRLISQRPPSIYHQKMLLSRPPSMDQASTVDLS